MPGKPFSKLCVVLAITASLSACGGGSGSISSSSGTPLFGSAAKGFLTNANVSVFAISNGGRGKLLGSTTTDSAGNYTFATLPQSSGPVLVEIITTANSKMIDELNGSISAPAGLRLRAVVPDISRVREAHLTPFSEMAAAAVEAAGNITDQTITAANQAVEGQYFGGASILTTKPLKVDDYANSTDSPRRALTKALTAVVAAAEQGDATGTDGLSCVGTYAAKVKCAVEGLAKGVEFNGSGEAVIKALRVELVAKGIDYLNAGTVKPRDSQNTTRLFNEPLNNEMKIRQIADNKADVPLKVVRGTTFSDIAAARALLGDLRSNLVSISSSATQNFLSPVLAELEADIDLKSFNIATRFIKMLTDGVRLANGALADTTQLNTCTKIDAYTASCQAALVLDTGFVSLSITVSKSGDVFNWVANSTQMTCTASGCDPTASAGPVTGTITATIDASGPVSSFHATGDMIGLGPDGLGSGSMDISGNSQNVNGAGPNGPSGTFDVSGIVRTLKDGQPFAEVRLGEGSRLAYKSGANNNLVRLVIDTLETPKHRFTGEMVFDEFVTNPRVSGGAASPSRFVFSGAAIDRQHAAVGKFFEGTIRLKALNADSFDPTSPESASNFLRGTLQVGGKLKVEADKTVGVWLTMGQPLYRVIAVTLGYEYENKLGTNALTIEARRNVDTKETRVDITNPAKVRITLQGNAAGESSGKVYRDSERAIGTIDTQHGRVDFEDGSYESLN